MPNDSYDFMLADDIRNFRMLMYHIGYGIYWWEENFIKGGSTAWNPPTLTPFKEETTVYLAAAFTALEQTINAIPLSKEAVTGFHTTLDHITHHRRQATTYLRCKGITPPAYTY